MPLYTIFGSESCLYYVKRKMVLSWCWKNGADAVRCGIFLVTANDENLPLQFRQTRPWANCESLLYRRLIYSSSMFCSLWRMHEALGNWTCPFWLIGFADSRSWRRQGLKTYTAGRRSRNLCKKKTLKTWETRTGEHVRRASFVCKWPPRLCNLALGRSPSLFGMLYLITLEVPPFPLMSSNVIFENCLFAQY